MSPARCPVRLGARAVALVLLCSACGDAGDGSARDQPDAAADAGSDPPSDASVPELDAGHDAGAATDGGDEPARDAGSDAADVEDQDPPPDRDPPVLVLATPADGDDNVASDVTPQLVFSEPVVLGPGALRLRQRVPARTIELSAETSADGLSVELTLDEPIELPAELTLELGAGITDLAGNALEPIELRFSVPIWLRLGGALNRSASATATDLQLALDDQERPVLLAVDGDDVYASRFEDGAFEALGEAVNEGGTLASAGAEARLALAIDGSGAPLAAFRQSDGVSVVGWDGSSWSPVADAPDPDGGGSHAPALALGASGEPIVAFDALDGSAQPMLQLRALSGGSWQTLESLAVSSAGVRLAGDGQSNPTLAYQEPGEGIFALRWNGASLSPIGASAALAASSGGFAMSVSEAGSCVLSAPAQGTITWGSSDWSVWSQDLGFLDSSAAGERVLGHAPDEALLAAFTETPAGARAAQLFVQRHAGQRFEPLGPPLNRERNAQAARPALAVDAAGVPIVAWLETPLAGGLPQIFVSRFNGDPSAPPFGVPERAHDSACLSTAPTDGSLLTDTECFADALGREPVSGFVPFDVRSALWSDGAFKRRFFMLPEGASIAYRDPGIWTFPEGTILIKEFAIEGRRGDPSTLRPVETRFLIVRDDGDWDRYSYAWDQDATEAVLRPAAPPLAIVDFAIEDELGAPAVHSHFYPTRAQCLSCHQAPGTVLGLQTAMLNRNFDYGATVDNQLRALQAAGLFGASLDAEDVPLARFMPSPLDTTYSTEARLRAALHANCSSCHHPLQALDLRIQVATLDTGLCSKLSKGSLDDSLIYWRDVLRGYPPNQPGVAPMPPVGTLVPNPLLEELLTDFILDPDNPCP